ncbi:MAG: hypothetical protein HYY17_12750 [Planctomycetes bacterium]|nr:hypothetical protein [Planctomycetota bacterium]
MTTASPGQHSFHSEFHSNEGRTGVPFKFGFYAAVCPCNWTFDRARLITGTLPPGLRIEGIQIVGVPERTGKWNCTVALEGFRCDCGAFQGPNFDYCRSGVILLFDIDR